MRLAGLGPLPEREVAGVTLLVADLDAGAGLLFASCLTAAHLYYYDETVFLLPLLTLWSDRAVLSRWQVAALIVLTAVYYIAARYVLMWSLAFDGPPIQTFCVLALWLLSLTVKAEESRA